MLLLVAVPIAMTFFGGVLAGAAGQALSVGAPVIFAAIPVAALIGWLTARTVLAGALSIRQEQSAYWIEDKLDPLKIELDVNEPARINIVHPAIDLKHFFGGFITVFTLARRLVERGHKVRLVALDSVDLPGDWRERLAEYESIGQFAAELEVVDASDRSIPVAFNPADSVLATQWTAAWVADDIVGKLDADHFLYLIQEYEPFVFPRGSAALMAEGSYDLAHTALFSTGFLKDYFATNGYGVYRSGRPEGDGHSLSFRNAITPVGPVTAAGLERPGPRRLLFYARPEPHAARNLFEIGLMALDIAVCEGCFKGWDLVGIGKVDGDSDSLELPRSGAKLAMLPRTGQDDYGTILAGFDVGLALMYTPHPSLVPIEMAAAGLSTVNNTFANKDAAALGAISGNLIAAAPGLGPIAAALADAERASGDLESRAAGSRVDWPDSWEQALDEPTMAAIEQLLG